MNDDVFRPGELCGTYRIIKLLGRGGFADVYQALDVTTQQKVALKCLQLRHLTNAQITQRMVAETELLSELDHPNIIQVDDAGINGGVLWLAMEYIAGGTLRERLRRARGPLPLASALKYARQVADGVGAAHGLNVVHRDLKPENIMITDKDEVKVLDLGAAKFFGKDLTATGTGGAIGTPLYMAPEQIKGEAVDARTDVYALGTILYEMIAGRHPFAQPSGELPPAFEIGTLHLHAKPKALTEVVSGLPEPVWRVVERALAKEPSERFASMSDFMAAIRAVSHGPFAATTALEKRAPIVQLRRPPTQMEPGDVDSATDHRSGIRDVMAFLHARAEIDTLQDVEPPFMTGDVGASSESSEPMATPHLRALSFAELVPDSGERSGDADRLVAGSGPVPRILPAPLEAPPPPPLAPSAPPPVASEPFAPLATSAPPPVPSEPLATSAPPTPPVLPVSNAPLAPSAPPPVASEPARPFDTVVLSPLVAAEIAATEIAAAEVASDALLTTRMVEPAPPTPRVAELPSLIARSSDVVTVALPSAPEAAPVTRRSVTSEPLAATTMALVPVPPAALVPVPSAALVIVPPAELIAAPPAELVPPAPDSLASPSSARPARPSRLHTIWRKTLALQAAVIVLFAFFLLTQRGAATVDALNPALRSAASIDLSGAIPSSPLVEPANAATPAEAPSDSSNAPSAERATDAARVASRRAAPSRALPPASPASPAPPTTDREVAAKSNRSDCETALLIPTTDHHRCKLASSAGASAAR